MKKSGSLAGGVVMSMAYRRLKFARRAFLMGSTALYAARGLNRVRQQMGVRLPMEKATKPSSRIVR